MGSLPPIWAARVPEPCVPPAWRYPAPSEPLAGAPPVSGPPPGSFRPHVRTPAGSARIVPLWLSCSPKPSFLLGLEARIKVYDLWFTSGARSKHRKGPIQSSELTLPPFSAATPSPPLGSIPSIPNSATEILANSSGNHGLRSEERRVGKEC